MTTDSDGDTYDGDSINVLVGERIRRMREAKRIPARALADRLKVMTEQVGAYESGRQRVSASRLFEIAQTLDVPVSAFFTDVREPDGAPTPRGRDDGLGELVGAWAALRPDQRDRLLELASLLIADAG